MTGDRFTDCDVRAAVQAECDKRNKHISRFHPSRWIPLWDNKDGWHPALRPKGFKGAEPSKRMRHHAMG